MCSMLLRRVCLKFELVSEDGTFSEYCEMGLSKKAIDTLFRVDGVVKAMQNCETYVTAHFNEFKRKGVACV